MSLLNPSVRSIGRVLAMERKKRDWSTREIVRRADGINSSTVVFDVEEREKTSLRTVLAYCDALGLPLTTVLDNAMHLEMALDLEMTSGMTDEGELLTLRQIQGRGAQ